MNTPKRVVIVGNGPVPPGSADSIEAADAVIRFNNPKQPLEQVGTKTDIIFMMNSGKPMQARLANQGFLNSPVLRNAKEIMLAYHPTVIARYHPKPNPLSWLKGRRTDWTWRIIEVFGELGKSVTILPVTFYEESCDDLGLELAQRYKVFPSTGYLGTRYALDRFPAPEWRIELLGFSWAGWKRHDWAGEEDWMRRKEQEGLLDLSALV
jgi:hypothetical protein